MRWRLIVLTFAMMLPVTIFAGEGPQVSDPLPISIRHTRVMASEVMAEDRRFSVHLPRGYEQQPSRSYPMMIVLDGGAWAGLMAETLHSYRMRGAAPPVIVVGVGNTDRTRDLTTTHVDDMPTSGGADKFAKFLGDELIPYIDQEYRTNSYRIIFGHSFGGLFGVYSVICHQELGFDACIAASPALYYDRGPTLRKIEKVLAENPPQGPKFFYLSMANELSYAEAIDFLKEQFGDEDWVRWQEKKYAEETHGSVPKRVIPDGVEALFANWSMSRSTMNGGWEKVADHHKMLSKQMGYEVLVPEAMANTIGYQEMNRGDTSDAIKIFEWNAQTYPASVNVWDSLGEALLAKGRLADAAVNYEKVLALAPGDANALKMLDIIRNRQSD
ncbi:MAG: putative alpha/beta superfamily hydrolase [Candidatus Krumholzibacteriia bacterium]|jgi:predicted alpha/beta superfamily hydrolase